MKDSQELPPQLTKLDDTYDVLAELHRIGDTPTYLARHRKLGRDVTITVVHVPGGGDNNTLTHFASDARLLATMRHPNIIPVVEGRWLDSDTFAVVRARVRGSTLEQVLSAVGPMPIPRVANTLKSVDEALQWARANGVVHRRVSAESLVFQQPTGRVLLALEPVMLQPDALPDVCDDTRTLGLLAWEMLTGKRYDPAEPPTESLISLRPELPPMVAAETEAMLHCQRGEDATDIGAYLALLTGAAVAPAPANPVEARPQPVANQGAAAETTEAQPREERTAERAAEVAAASMAGAAAARAAEPRNSGQQTERVVATPITREPSTPTPPPHPVSPTSAEAVADERPRSDDVAIARDSAATGAAAGAIAGAAAGAAASDAKDDDDTVIVQQHGMGFNGRMLAAVVVAAVLLIVAAFAIRDHSHQKVRIDANAPLADTSNAAAGDVALTNPQTATLPNSTTAMTTLPPGVQPGVPGAPAPAGVAGIPSTTTPGGAPGAASAGAVPITGGTAVTPGAAAPIMSASPYSPATTVAAPRRTSSAPRQTRSTPSATGTPVMATPAQTTTSDPSAPTTATPPNQPADTAAKTVVPPKVEVPPPATIRQPVKKDSATKDTTKKDTTVKHDTTAKADSTTPAPAP